MFQKKNGYSDKFNDLKVADYFSIEEKGKLCSNIQSMVWTQALNKECAKGSGTDDSLNTVQNKLIKPIWGISCGSKHKF